jgi:hypothetical protein
MARLSDIPFYGAYREREAQIQQEPMRELQQAQGVLTLSGLLQQQQQKQQAAQREQSYRQELQALGPNPTQEALAQVASKYAAPDDVLKVHQGSLDRAATREATAATNKARLEEQARAAERVFEQRRMHGEQMHEFRLMGARTAEERAAEVARHNAATEAANLERTAMEGRFKALRLEIRAAGQTKPPSGYRATAGGNLEPIPGGPADTKLQGVLNQDTATLTQSEAALDRLAVAANEVLQHPGLGRTTGTMGILPNIPGFPGANAAAKLDTLKAQVGFGVLQEMRNASKTGGALGQITERELAFLQNALASLDKAQSEEQIKDSLDKIIKYTGAAKGRLRGAYNLRHGDRTATPPPAQPPAASPIDALLEKYK